MSLIEVGNFNAIDVSVEEVRKKVTKRALATNAALDLIPPKLQLDQSPNQWGLFLKSLTLHKSFEGVLANWFNPKNEIYFVSIAWDYSGNAAFVYPPKGAVATDFLIPMRSETTYQFIGDGVNLWPVSTVVGALNLVVLVYECDADVQRVGKTLREIHDQVESSELTNLITAIAANPALVQGVAVEQVVNEFVGVIGKILEQNGDDYVDIFHGSYGVNTPQESRIERYNHSSVGLELQIVVV